MLNNLPHIEDLIRNRGSFDSFVYTPVQEAVEELKRRWENPAIKKVANIPTCIKNGFRVIQSVCLVTPNYLIRRFINAADALDMDPLIFERKEDLYVPQNNEWKHGLGKMRFFTGRSKNANFIMEYKRVIDFNANCGKPISLIKTLWGQDFSDFHHEIFFKIYPNLSYEKHFFDNSNWFHEVGGTTHSYYVALLSLTIQHGILFENFMLDKKEIGFTRDVFLPAFLEVYQTTGIKPLIVALEPTDVEGDQFWTSYPKKELEILDGKFSDIV